MRNYKKIIALATALTLFMGLAACGGAATTAAATTAAATTAAAVETTAAPVAETTAAATETTAAAVETTVAETTAAPAAGGMKTGLAVNTVTGKSKAATAEEPGVATIESSIVAVLVAEDGTIADIKIDALRADANFDATGKVTTDMATTFMTKQELGADYGMNWMDQAKTLEEYAKGKTIEEIKATKLTAEGVPDAVDALAGVSIHINDTIDTIELAVNNAKAIGAGEGDKLGLGTVASLNGTKSVGEDERNPEVGTVQVYEYFTALTVNGEGKVTSAINDAAQGVVKFDATGAITSDTTAVLSSKNVIGEGYGMKKASAIGKEWNEQADAFAQYFVGKTAEEIAGTTLDDTGHVTDADLLSSVTVHVNDFITTAAKAFESAK